jgi:hypothetical protein
VTNTTELLADTFFSIYGHRLRVDAKQGAPQWWFRYSDGWRPLPLKHLWNLAQEATRNTAVDRPRSSTQLARALHLVQIRAALLAFDEWNSYGSAPAHWLEKPAEAA